MEQRTFGIQRYKYCRHDGVLERAEAQTHIQALDRYHLGGVTEYTSYQPKLRNDLRAKVWDGSDIRWYYSKRSERLPKQRILRPSECLGR